jgi:branched-chain amino acid transport system substrate-binding protein
MSDGPRDPQLLTLVTNAKALEGAQGTAPGGPDVASHAGDPFRGFQQRYAARYGRPPNLFAEIAYDAVYIAAIAIEAAGTDDPNAVVVALPKAQSGAPGTAGDWKTISGAIHGGGQVNYSGASGGCKFDAKGDLLPPYYYSIWTISGGTISTTRTETCLDPSQPGQCPAP